MKLSVLLSYWGCPKGWIDTINNMCKEQGVEFDLFIDSGAFSASTHGAPISIDEYMHFIRDHFHLKPLYANMDVIGDHIKTDENQRIMESWGLSPMPVYHAGTPIKEFERLHERYEYIAVGGLVGGNPKTFPTFMQHLADILEKKGYRKIHVFGVTPRLRIMSYPWHSFDSTSWAAANLGNRISIRSIGGDEKQFQANDFKQKKKITALGASVMSLLGTDTSILFKNGKMNYKIGHLVQLLLILEIVKKIIQVTNNPIVYYIAGLKHNLIKWPLLFQYLKRREDAGETGSDATVTG